MFVPEFAGIRRLLAQIVLALPTACISSRQAEEQAKDNSGERFQRQQPHLRAALSLVCASSGCHSPLRFNLLLFAAMNDLISSP